MQQHVLVVKVQARVHAARANSVHAERIEISTARVLPDCTLRKSESSRSISIVSSFCSSWSCTSRFVLFSKGTFFFNQFIIICREGGGSCLDLCYCYNLLSLHLTISISMSIAFLLSFLPHTATDLEEGVTIAGLTTTKAHASHVFRCLVDASVAAAAAAAVASVLGSVGVAHSHIGARALARYGVGIVDAGFGLAPGSFTLTMRHVA